VGGELPAALFGNHLSVVDRFWVYGSAFDILSYGFDVLAPLPFMTFMEKFAA